MSDLRARLQAEPRWVPQVRVLRTILRTLHLIAFAALYGGHVYGVAAEPLLPALYATLLTGGAFMALEIYRTPVWLVQVRGALTLVKIVLVASVAVFWDLRVLILTLVMVIGVIAAHMPGRWRYHSLLHGRMIGTIERG